MVCNQSQPGRVIACTLIQGASDAGILSGGRALPHSIRRSNLLIAHTSANENIGYDWYAGNRPCTLCLGHGMLAAGGVGVVGCYTECTQYHVHHGYHSVLIRTGKQHRQASILQLRCGGLFGSGYLPRRATETEHSPLCAGTLHI